MYVYILLCSDKSYYTGVTNNVERRLIEHNIGINKTCYTFPRRPVTLMYHEMFTDPNLAIAHEKQIKGWSRKKKEALISGNYDQLPLLSLNAIKAAKTLRQAQSDNRTNSGQTQTEKL